MSCSNNNEISTRGGSEFFIIVVLFLVINGRLASSIGADMVDLTDIMENYGAYNAANLDGGSSSALIINQQIINTPVAGGSNGLRDMSTFWVVK